MRALRGLVRLKTLVQGQSVKRQAASTLRSMQTLARLQSQIRERRIRMSEENQALQRQLHQKHEKELEKLRAAVRILCIFSSSVMTYESMLRTSVIDVLSRRPLFNCSRFVNSIFFNELILMFSWVD